MKRKIRQAGFSLAEVLMALGILSIGILFIAAIFPAGIYFETISTERTIAAVVADEAFAKIRLYGNDSNFNPNTLDVELMLFPAVLDPNEFSYPSDLNIAYERKMYCWSAVWRRLSSDPTDRNVQVTVFVSRKAGVSTKYYELSGGENGDLPVAVPVGITANNTNEITIDNQDYKTFLTEGCTIVDGETGFLYRVLGRDDADPSIVILDKDFIDLDSDGKSDVWVVPHPVGGGRAPCIAVYQKIIRF
jgi:prepilin-type N-terminal cleavage/methylation domain-containing protein